MLMYTMELLNYDLKEQALHLSEETLSLTDPTKTMSSSIFEDCLLFRSIRVHIYLKTQKKYEVD